LLQSDFLLLLLLLFSFLLLFRSTSCMFTYGLLQQEDQPCSRPCLQLVDLILCDHASSRADETANSPSARLIPTVVCRSLQPEIVGDRS
jgi:hypothetical protein